MSAEPPPQTDAATAMKQRIRGDLRLAMRDRRTAEVEVLRCLLGALDQAEAVPVTGGSAAGVPFGEAEAARKRLSADDVRAVILAEREEIRTVAAELTRRGRPDAAAAHLLRAALLDGYLA